MRKKKQTDVERLNRLLRRRTTTNGLHTQRSLCFGGSGAAIACALSVFDLPSKSLEIQIALCAAAVSAPLWIAAGLIYEIFIDVGKQGHAFWETPFGQHVLGLTLLSAGLSLALSIATILYDAFDLAGVLFVASVALAIFLVSGYHERFAKWFFAADKDRPNEEQ